jgi:ssDNA-binding Zn-finger/Zn-ribbon topoisomerase 1
MGFIESLFSGVRVFVSELITVVAEAVRCVLKEIDRSPFGRAATQLLQGATRKYFSTAQNLVDEEREFGEKFMRDGRRSEADAERLQEITAERDILRKQIDAAKASNAAQEFRENQDQVVAVAASDDEASATVGIIASKTCPECGETMRIRQGGFNDKTERRRFYWQCTSTKFACPSIKLDPAKGGGYVIRKQDPNLDFSAHDRRVIWERKDVLVETASRLRNALDEYDNEIICPTHLLLMKLVERRAADGRLLTTYEYVCRAVDSEGRACRHRISLETFPQVSEALRRREGQGIIKG